MKRVSARPYIVLDEMYLKSWRAPDPGTEEFEQFTEGLDANQSNTFTFLSEDNEILGIGGIVYHNLSNAEAWNMLNDDALSMPALPRAVRDLLHWLQEDRKIIRIWAAGDPDENATLHRWFTFLGLTYETTLPAWENGESRDIYSRIRRWT